MTDIERARLDEMRIQALLLAIDHCKVTMATDPKSGGAGEVLDVAGRMLEFLVGGGDAKDVVYLASAASPIRLTNAEYEAIRAAQQRAAMSGGT